MLVYFHLELLEESPSTNNDDDEFDQAAALSNSN